MLPDTQRFVVYDVQKDKISEEFSIILMPEKDPHAQIALAAYARSLARVDIRSATRIQGVLKSLGFEFELFPGEKLKT